MLLQCIGAVCYRITAKRQISHSVNSSKFENGGHLEFCHPIFFKTFSDHEKGILHAHLLLYKFAYRVIARREILILERSVKHEEETNWRYAILLTSLYSMIHSTSFHKVSSDDMHCIRVKYS